MVIVGPLFRKATILRASVRDRVRIGIGLWLRTGLRLMCYSILADLSKSGPEFFGWATRKGNKKVNKHL